MLQKVTTYLGVSLESMFMLIRRVQRCCKELTLTLWRPFRALDSKSTIQTLYLHAAAGTLSRQKEQLTLTKLEDAIAVERVLAVATRVS